MLMKINEWTQLRSAEKAQPFNGRRRSSQATYILRRYVAICTPIITVPLQLLLLPLPQLVLTAPATICSEVVQIKHVRQRVSACSWQ
jgi:hypothetical protein